MRSLFGRGSKALLGATLLAMINTSRWKGKSSDLKKISGLGVGDFPEDAGSPNGVCLPRLLGAYLQIS